MPINFFTLIYSYYNIYIVFFLGEKKQTKKGQNDRMGAKNKGCMFYWFGGGQVLHSEVATGFWCRVHKNISKLQAIYICCLSIYGWFLGFM